MQKPIRKWLGKVGEANSYVAVEFYGEEGELIIADCSRNVTLHFRRKDRRKYETLLDVIYQLGETLGWSD